MKKKRHLKTKYKVLLVILISFVSIIAWSRYISTTGLIIKEYKVESDDLPISFDGLKIIHFTDVHYGRTINKLELDNLVTEINALKPDLIFFTGDLIDRDIKVTSKVKDDVTNALSKLTPVSGKYAISGNHDFSLKKYDDIIKDSGFINLDNTYTTVYSHKHDTIFIAGLESEIKGHPDLKDITTYLDSNNVMDENGNPIIVNDIPSYKILLLHTPDTFDKVKDNNFNLVLAGHSHNGQVRLPFFGAVITPLGSKKYYEEYYNINTTDFYISSGLGTSTINLRFFNKPSFSFYRLVTKQ